MRATLRNMPVCACGHKRFRTIEAGRSRTGKRHFVVACLACSKRLDVSKTTFALCEYLMTHEHSKSFLQLYHLES
ncbi:MAG: hypothetical protein IPG71_08875 [bacterium]|nr:hypothetical protein [bacterium]